MKIDLYFHTNEEGQNINHIHQILKIYFNIGDNYRILIGHDCGQHTLSILIRHKIIL